MRLLLLFVARAGTLLAQEAPQFDLPDDSFTWEDALWTLPFYLAAVLFLVGALRSSAWLRAPRSLELDKDKKAGES